MWKRLKVTHSLNVRRQTVEFLIKQIDPEGVACRSNKFKQRKYSASGPNHIWHIDGYDKLKPFGFPIHGCIDGYSRFILWLKVNIKLVYYRNILFTFTKNMKKISGFNFK